MKTQKLKFCKGSRTKNAPTCPCGRPNKGNAHFNPFEGFNGEYGFCHSCPDKDALHMPNNTKEVTYVAPPPVPQKFIEEPNWNWILQDTMIDPVPENAKKLNGQYSVTFYFRNVDGKLCTSKKIIYNFPEFKREKSRIPIHEHLRDSGYYPCLFNERDLTTYPQATVILVESEKTAALLRYKFKAYLSEFIYLSISGAGSLSINKMKVLKGRNVIIAYDCDIATVDENGKVRGRKGRDSAQEDFIELLTIAKPLIVDIDPEATDGKDLGDIVKEIDIDYIRTLHTKEVPGAKIPDTLLNELRAIHRAGEKLDDAIVQKLGESYDVNPDKIYTLNSTLRQVNPEEFAIDKASMVQRVEHWLGERYDFRRNIITSHILYRPKAAPTWKLCNSNDLWRQIHHNLKDFGPKAKIPRGDIDNIIDSEFVPTWNPFEDYFENLPPWDGVDHINKLASHVQCENQGFWLAQFKKALIRHIACTLDHVDNRHVMVLVSEKQNLGKSWFIRNLCPPELADEYYKETPLAHDKDSHIALTENFIWNLEELDDLNRKEIAALKAIISTSRVKERRAYARYETSMHRIVNFWGSTNKTEFLTDTENTRWLCFNVISIDHNYDNRKTHVKNIDITAVWAQAYHLFKAGEDFVLTSEEKEAQAISNRNFETMTAEKHLILRHFLPVQPGTPLAEFMANQDIVETLNKHTQNGKVTIESRNIGRAMKQLGFKDDRKTINSVSVRGYWVRYLQVAAQYENTTSQTEMFPVDDEAVELPF